MPLAQPSKGTANLATLNLRPEMICDYLAWKHGQENASVKLIAY